MAYNNRFTVGLLVANIMDPFSNGIAKGAALAAEYFDVNLIIVPGKYIDRDIRNDVVNMRYEYQHNALFSHVSTGNLDYLIICVGTIAYMSSDERKLEFMSNFKDTPILSVAARVGDYDYLIYDNQSGIAQAVDFLVKKAKRKHIAMMTGDLNNYECRERFISYRNSLEENGLKYDSELAVSCDISENCKKEVSELIDSHPEIDAVLCANDAIATAVYDVLKERDIEIGKDISVVGFDDQPLSAKMEPPLSSVRADAETLGYKAVEKAAHFLNNKDHISNTLETTFIPRASCLEGVNELSDSDNTFNKSTQEIVNDMLSYIFDKPVSAKAFNIASNFFTEAVDELVKRFVKKETTVHDFNFFKYFFNDFFNKDFMFNDIIEKVYNVVDNCYSQLKEIVPKQNLDYLHMTFDYLYKRLSYDLVSTYNYIEDKYIEQGHRSNLFARDTLMFDSNLNNSYASILQPLPCIGSDTGYLYVFDEPVSYKGNKMFTTDVQWNIMSYNYGFDIFNVPIEKQKITSAQLFNNPYLPENRRYTLIMADLYSNEFQYGMVLCEPHDFDFFKNLELVTYQISAAVRITRLLKQQEKMLNDLNSSNLALENISRIDELTGIYNRRGFYATANEYVTANAFQDNHYIVAYADMDNLKMVNDAYGHIEGDFSLKSLANCLKEIFGNSSIVGRVGGDEYVVLVKRHLFRSFDEIIEKKKQVIARLNEEAGKPYKINMSMGLYECVCTNSYDLKDSIDKADDILYTEKKHRKKEI